VIICINILIFYLLWCISNRGFDNFITTLGGKGVLWHNEYPVTSINACAAATEQIPPDATFGAPDDMEQR
jgi:hypothetical protein